MSTEPNPRGIATRDEILDALWKIGKITRPIDSDKQSIYADAIESEKLTRAQLGDMVMTCTKTLKVGFFPTPAKLLEFARPPSVNAPSGDGAPYDAIRSLENELSVQLAWRNRFRDQGQDHRADQIEKDCAKIRDHIDRRLQERGLAPRYAGNGGAATWTGQL